MYIDKNELQNVYTELGSIQKTAKHYKCRGSNISQLLHEYKIEIYPHKGEQARKHPLNEEYFIKYNTNKQALYWLGFLTADGYIKHSKGQYYIGLALAKKDKEHLHIFRKCLQSSAPIYKQVVKNSKRNIKYKDSINYGIHIHSKKIVNSLNEFGLLIPNKSLNVLFPDLIINHKDINHYCRGYVDGDGGFGFQKGQLYFRVRGTKEFLKTLNNVMINNTILDKKCLNKTISYDSGCYSIRYNGNNICKTIVQWLYKDIKNQIYLPRKYDIIKNVL